MKKSAYPLYNLLFPIWLLWIFPITWLLILPANLILDLTVIVITLKVLKIQDGFSLVQKSIWKVWIMGFAADIVGSLLMFSVQFFNGSARWLTIPTPIPGPVCGLCCALRFPVR